MSVRINIAVCHWLFVIRIVASIWVKVLMSFSCVFVVKRVEVVGLGRSSIGYPSGVLKPRREEVDIRNFRLFSIKTLEVADFRTYCSLFGIELPLATLV